MEQIKLVYSIPKETVTTKIMFYEYTKSVFRSSNEDSNFFNIEVKLATLVEIATTRMSRK